MNKKQKILQKILGAAAVVFFCTGGKFMFKLDEREQ